MVSNLLFLWFIRLRIRFASLMLKRGDDPDLALEKSEEMAKGLLGPYVMEKIFRFRRYKDKDVKVSFELKGDKQVYHDIIKSIWLKGQYQKALDAVLCDLIGSEPDLSQITSGDVLLELEAIRRRIKQLRSGKPNTDNSCQSGQ